MKSVKWAKTYSCALLLAPLLTSCSLHSVEQNILLPDSVPSEFSQNGNILPSSAWWKTFDSSVLDSLIEEALNVNLDLLQSAARVRQAAALAEKAGAPLTPSINLEGNGSRARSFLTGRGSSVENRYNLGLSIQYELDLWKRISSLEEAAKLDAQATAESYHQLSLIIAAEVSKTWLELLEQHLQLELLRRQEEVSATFLSLIELRFSQGQATAVEVYQQRELVASIQSQIPPVVSRIEILELALAVLLGKEPRASIDYLPEQFKVTTPGDSSSFGVKGISFDQGELSHSILDLYHPLPQIGLPGAVLLARPDIRASQLKLLAADYRLGASIADQLPRLSLSGSAGYHGTEARDIFDNWIWNIAGNLFQPLIDGGSRQAEVNRQQAIVDEAILSYVESVHQALQEIENALSREKYQLELCERLKAQLDFARTAHKEAQFRYLSGLSPYLTVLTQVQAVQKVERLLLNAQKELLLHRVDLYRALGGPWLNSAEAVSPEDPTQSNTVSLKDNS